MTIGPLQGTPDVPDAYEAPNGVEAALPGQVDDAGSRDPSSTTVEGSITNAMAQQAELESDLFAQGGTYGDEIPLPDYSGGPL
jgi:hypothetical protein